MRGIRNILFDVGGTLIHLDRRFVIQTLKELGVDATEDDFFRAHAAGIREISRIMRSPDPGNDATRWRAYGAILMREMNVGDDAALSVFESISRRHAEGKLWSLVEEGTPEVLAELSKNYRLGIVSNADGRIEQFLRDVGIADFFETIVDSGIVGIEKPDPRIFDIACANMRIEKNETVYVGDIYDIDIVGARNAGIRGILLFNGQKDPNWDCPVIGKVGQIPTVLSGVPL